MKDHYKWDDLGSWSRCVPGACKQILSRPWCGGCRQYHESHLHQELQWWHPGYHPADAVS